AYCDALTVLEAAAGRLPPGYEYRLPTEAEWEYCCRAGTTTEYHYGSSLDCGQAMFQYSYFTSNFCGGPAPSVVGSYSPNAWGLHDMHGNIAEWCLDSWDGTANYPGGSVLDPYVTSGPNRVWRGGGFGSSTAGCRSASRNYSAPSAGGSLVGFRIVCAPVLP
ncbi:MAG: formylglycine-generating enzyme family protein, partial [Planctomycetes bacterium]|nr:formylglycine-generating enzyme family protein [Planctomycetota bacterium]